MCLVDNCSVSYEDWNPVHCLLKYILAKQKDVFVKTMKWRLLSKIFNRVNVLLAVGIAMCIKYVAAHYDVTYHFKIKDKALSLH